MSDNSNLDLVSRLTDEEETVRRFSLRCVSPDDGKYIDATNGLASYITSEAEWLTCADVQRVLLETRVEFGMAGEHNLSELRDALDQIDPLNMALLEDKIRHDQLAVIEELGRFVSSKTKALLHPGTTSYDILDTARSYLFKKAWYDTVRPKVVQVIEAFCELAEQFISADKQAFEETGKMRFLQTGRTHLQNTSPVPFGVTLAGYAARLAERVARCDLYFSDLRGKISGIVGTGASIEMVIGKDRALEFEAQVLEKLDLKPDLTATQIIQKEKLADVGHGLVTLMWVLADFADDIRLLYSSAINEVTSRDNAERLGGSSADAAKNNPINYENPAGKAAVVESGMRVLYAMIDTDLQRDLRGSVQGRYQPQSMMVQVYEAFSRIGKALGQLSINEDRMAENLGAIRKSPSEAMVAILRGEGWKHSEFGVGHDFVKEMGKRAKREERPFLEICLEDEEFQRLFQSLDQNKRDILSGGLEKYIGPSFEKAAYNIAYARETIEQKLHIETT